MMIRYGLLTLISFFLFSACAETGEEPLTLPEDKMVEILLDAHMLESALQDVTHSKKDSVKKAFYLQFYEIHGISENQFIENIEIMDQQPKMLSRIYSKVMEEVSKLEADQ